MNIMSRNHVNPVTDGGIGAGIKGTFDMDGAGGDAPSDHEHNEDSYRLSQPSKSRHPSRVATIPTGADLSYRVQHGIQWKLL